MGGRPVEGESVAQLGPLVHGRPGRLDFDTERFEPGAAELVDSPGAGERVEDGSVTVKQLGDRRDDGVGVDGRVGPAAPGRLVQHHRLASPADRVGNLLGARLAAGLCHSVAPGGSHRLRVVA